MKIFFRRIHLYLGLATGLIIMITCFTGAVLVYEKDLQQLFNRNRYFTNNGGERLSADRLIAEFQKKHPGNKVSSLKIFSDPGRNAEISFSPLINKKQQSAAVKPKREVKLVAFVDPYNGVIKEIYNHRESFFYFIMDLHRWMLGGDTGKLIVGICTVVFLFILITGLILWWPKNKAILKQRLKIKTGAGFKRLNHDYHVVLGFYSSIFLFILAFTGLAWSFEWFNDGIYSLTNSKKERASPLKSLVVRDQKAEVENALSVVRNEEVSPYYHISIPKDSLEAFSITILPPHSSHESATDNYFVDQYSGSLLGVQTFASRNKGQRIRASFKPIHVASIYGHTSKAIGFLACLAGTFFPLSGIIMWINRSRKKSLAKKRD